MADQLTPMLQRLADYVEARLIADSAPVASAALTAGLVAWDHCCEQGGGQLRVRAVQTYDTNPFPAPASTPSPCWRTGAVDVEVSVMRCAATMDDRGNPPPDTELDAEAARIHADRMAMLAALKCDFVADGTLDEDRPMVNVRWQALGPQGGCVGGQVTVTLGLSECPCQEP